MQFSSHAAKTPFYFFKGARGAIVKSEDVSHVLTKEPETYPWESGTVTFLEFATPLSYTEAILALQSSALGNVRLFPVKAPETRDQEPVIAGLNRAYFEAAKEYVKLTVLRDIAHGVDNRPRDDGAAHDTTDEPPKKLPRLATWNDVAGIALALKGPRR